MMLARLTGFCSTGFSKCFTALLLFSCGMAVSTLPGQPLLGQSQRRPSQATKKHTFLTVEIYSNSSVALGGQQRWVEMLQKVGADRVSSKTSAGGAAGVDEEEVGGTRYIKVRGFLEGNKLVLASGSYRISDVAKIRDLFQKFRDDGKQTTLAAKHDFGLTAEQLVSLSEKLAKPVAESTEGKPLAAVADAIANQVGLPFVRDATARAALAGQGNVLQEFKGMSSGTALAALVKPLGLVLEPGRKQGQQVKVHVKRAQDSKLSWPVGREPEQVPVLAEPKLFQKMPIGIKNYPLDKVMDAVQKKAQIPFIYDEQVLASEGIDVAKTNVSISNKNGALMVMINKLLRQTKPRRLSGELRVDDGGKTFLWITVR